MTIMNRSEVLESLRTYLMMMQHQVKQAGNADFKFDFFFRVDAAFISKLDLYCTLGVLSAEDCEDLVSLHKVIIYEMEGSICDQFSEKRALFFSTGCSITPKYAQGYPLQPVQLCNLLEQEIFKGLPALGDSRPVIEPV